MRPFKEDARLVSTAVMAMVVAATNVSAGGPQPEPPNRIEQSIKMKASGRMMLCGMSVRAKGFLGAIDPQQEEDLLGKCSTKLESAFLKAEAKCQASGAADCVTNDAPVIGSRIQTLSDRLEAFLAQEAVPAQRYVDNGDGTITDNQTGLMWEKKSTAIASGNNFADPHDVDNLYTWSATIGGTMPNGTAFADFLDKLNNCTTTDGSTVTGGFAGHCDWRLPSVVELAGIVGSGCDGVTPCIDPMFGPTIAVYWSATTLGTSPNSAWAVNFYIGSVFFDTKGNVGWVRAVRGGL